MRWLLLGLLLPLKVCALYNGNPSLPMMPEMGPFISRDAWVGIKVGYEFDWVYSSPLKGQSQHLSDSKAHGYESMQNFGVVTLNFSDRVELFGDVGSMECQLHHAKIEKNRLSYVSKSDFAWEVGGRAIIAYWGDLQFAINAAFLRSDPALSSLKLNSISYSKEKAHIDLTSWQIGLGTSYRFCWCVPYVGVSYTKFRAKVEHLKSLSFLIPSQQVVFENNDEFGVFLGFGIGLNKALSLNMEGRFISENALSISADFKF